MLVQFCTTDTWQRNILQNKMKQYFLHFIHCIFYDKSFWSKLVSMPTRIFYASHSMSESAGQITDPQNSQRREREREREGRVQAWRIIRRPSFQVLGEAVCVSLSTNTFGKRINQSVLYQSWVNICVERIFKTLYANWSRRKNALNSNQPGSAKKLTLCYILFVSEDLSQ